MTTITETCPVKLFPEACAHYYSAIHDRGMADILTCEDGERRANLDVTDRWKLQHNSGEGWGAFTKPYYMYKGQEKKAVECQADEYPPGYFLPNDKEERKKPEWGQLIRWLPSQENGQAANAIWSGFCAKYDGGKDNRQRVDVKRKEWKAFDGKDKEQWPLQKELVDPGKSRVQSEEKGGTWTYTTIYDEITFTRAVMTVAFDYEEDDKPRKENDWYLSENPCWVSSHLFMTD